MSDTFVDVPEVPYEDEGANEDTVFGNAMELGAGSSVFRVDQSGMWLGAAKYADAPFSVDMNGNLVATSADFSGTGYTKTVTFAQDSIPTSVAVGDLWVDTNNDNKLYRAASIGADQITAGEWEVVDQDAFKLDKVGGQYVTTTDVTAKVEIFPDANTGIVAYAGNGTSEVFKVVVDGTDVGDVSMGDYAGGSGVLWDQSASTMKIKGDMEAGSIDGVTITGGSVTGSTIKTSASGVRIELAADEATLKFYDSGNDRVFEIDEDSYGQASVVRLVSADGRGMWLDSDEDIYITADVDLYLGVGTGGIVIADDTYMGGDIDMNDNNVKEINYLQFNTSGNETTNGRLWFYDAGGGNYYWRSRNGSWNGQFDQTGF